MFKILLVEDDENLSLLVRSKLENEGFVVVCAADGKAALEILDEAKFDLIITDVMMPYMDGLSLSKAVRASKPTPILMITAKSELEDMQSGFESGADDYMAKPINLAELVLRINALLRRAKITSEKRLVIGITTLDYTSLTAISGGMQVELTPKEFYLLFFLLSNEGKIFTRTQIMHEIWGYDSTSDERVVDTHIKKLRAKFATIEDFELVTIRGLGYKAIKKA